MSGSFVLKGNISASFQRAWQANGASLSRQAVPARLETRRPSLSESKNKLSLRAAPRWQQAPRPETYLQNPELARRGRTRASYLPTAPTRDRGAPGNVGPWPVADTAEP